MLLGRDEGDNYAPKTLAEGGEGFKLNGGKMWIRVKYTLWLRCFLQMLVCNGNSIVGIVGCMMCDCIDCHLDSRHFDKLMGIWIRYLSMHHQAISKDFKIAYSLSSSSESISKLKSFDCGQLKVKRDESQSIHFCFQKQWSGYSVANDGVSL